MIICADDYGISEAISRGIIDLIDGGRITATSCMVTGSTNLQEQMAIVADRRNHADIGLHLTLTNDRPVTDIRPEHGLVDKRGHFLTFNTLLFNCYRGRVDKNRLDQEIRAQLERFTELTGFPPAFVDGHQHAHQLPIVRDILVRACAETLQDDYYIRCGTFPAKWLMSRTLPNRLKMGSALIGLPAIGFKRALRRAGVRHNTNLLGHYSSREGLAFTDIFSRYLSLGPGTNDIFYAHPGYIDDELRAKDNLVDERISELEFLRGAQFLEHVDQSGIALNRFQFC